MTSDLHRKMGTRIGVVSGFTFLSRLAGLLRDVVTAYFFGASGAADAFYLAFRIPNLFRRLTGEGALTIAFVPVFTDYLKRSNDEAKKTASVVFTYLSIFLLIISISGVLLAPYIVRLIAYGFEKERFELAVRLTRIMFPYIFLISLTAFCMGILNSLKHFAAPAASPILLNIAIIFGAVFLSKFFAEPTFGLAFGVIIGGILQLALQVPPLVHHNMLPRINVDYRHPALKSILFMMVPAAFGAAVYQVNVLVTTFLASFLPKGSISYLWYADRLNEFPLGIFAIAVATVTLPTLSDHATDGDMEAFKKTFRFGLETAFSITIPASVGLVTLAEPIVATIFRRGNFSHYDAVMTGGVLSLITLGLPFVGGSRNITPAFFAMKDTKTPVKMAAVSVVVNALFAPFLMRLFGVRGLALSLVASNLANFLCLFCSLRMKIGKLGGSNIVRSLMRTLFASGVMACVILICKTYLFQNLLLSNSRLIGIGVISFLILAGGVSYILALFLIGAPEAETIVSLVRRRGLGMPPKG